MVVPLSIMFSDSSETLTVLEQAYVIKELSLDDHRHDHQNIVVMDLI